MNAENITGNLGYRFYRGTYRSQVNGDSRLQETDVPQSPLDVTEMKPDLEELAARLKPYRPEKIPDEAPQPDEPVDEMAAALAVLQARFGRPDDKRNNRNQRNAPKPAKPARDVKKERQQAERAAKTANSIVTFDLKVLYPGLYAGLGYTHGLPGGSDEIKVGFSFDYTTGLPYIPGSSLKGALRSRFINQPEDAAAALDIPQDALRRVENALFGNRTQDDDAHPGCLTCYDVFPVGVITNPNEPAEQKDQPLMATDNITPHKNPLAPPVPINTLRLRPKTVLRFCFSLPETVQTASGQFSLKQIIDAFRELLLDWGVGAKTNVGYGSLEKLNG